MRLPDHVRVHGVQSARVAVALAVAQGTTYSVVATGHSKPPFATHGKAAYAKFLEMALPRAFAVSSKGGFGVARGDYAAGRALGNCQRYGNPCILYAVDSDVVWKPQ